MRYFTFFHNKSSKPGLYIPIRVHLKKNYPHFTCSIMTCRSGYHTGQHKLHNIPIKHSWSAHLCVRRNCWQEMYSYVHCIGLSETAMKNYMLTKGKTVKKWIHS